MVKTEFAKENERIKVLLKDKANMAKNIDPDFSTYKSPDFYPANGSHVYTGNQTLTKGGSSGGIPGTMPGNLVPSGFKHYSHCTCYSPNSNNPRVTTELAEIEMLSE
jgi:hypothetical protein